MSWELSSSFLTSVVQAVKNVLRTWDDEVESVCNMKLGEIYETLADMKNDTERKRFAIVACKRAWLDHLKAEAVQAKHVANYEPPFTACETIITDDDSFHTVQR
jgi:tRNA G18 (ribose-2'-O)-methylase SpoU